MPNPLTSSFTHAGITSTFKSLSYHFAFTKDLYQYLFSLTKRNLKRIICFYEKKGKKQKQHSAFVLLRAVTEAVNTLSKSGTAKLLLWELHSASQP